jgi:hypothetical protein
MPMARRRGFEDEKGLPQGSAVAKKRENLVEGPTKQRRRKCVGSRKSSGPRRRRVFDNESGKGIRQKNLQVAKTENEIS